MLNQLSTILNVKFICRDNFGVLATYETIAVIEFMGNVDSSGHYKCDVKDKESGHWFRTNDNATPLIINREHVSNLPYVVLYKKKSVE